MFNPKAAGSNPVGRQLFCIACFNSRRSGGSSLWASGLVAYRPEVGTRND